MWGAVEAVAVAVVVAGGAGVGVDEGGLQGVPTVRALVAPAFPSVAEALCRSLSSVLILDSQVGGLLCGGWGSNP